MTALAMTLAPHNPDDELRVCTGGGAVSILPRTHVEAPTPADPEVDMRNVLAALPGLLLAGSLAAQAPANTHTVPPRSADERALFGLEDGWAHALVKRDTAYFRRTLAPGYVYTDETGVSTKEQVLAQMTSPDDTVDFAANEDMRAHVYGSTGVVTGVLVVRGRGKAGAERHRYRFTDTWIKRSGRWLLIASQDYDIPTSGPRR